MLEAVIFDMDGVLVDSEPLKAESWEKVLAKYRVENGGKWYTARIGTPGKDIAKEAVREFSLSVSDEFLFRDNRSLYLGMSEERATPIYSSIKFLESIPDYVKIGVASSEYKRVIERKMELIGINGFIQAITSGVEEVTHDKPHPEVYLRTAEKLGVLPEKCLAVEDSRTGVESAKNANMRCIGFRNPNSGNQDFSRADIIVDDLTKLDIEKILQ